MNLSVIFFLSFFSLIGCMPSTMNHAGPTIAQINNTWATEPDGFREIKWGTDIHDLKGMEYLRTDPSFGGVKMYRKKGDVLEIGNAKLESIEYGFWNNKFSNLIIRTNGVSDFNGLKSAFFQKYGAGIKTNTFMEDYIWDGALTKAALNLTPITEKGKLWMASAQLSKQQSIYYDTKTKEGATRGF